MINRKIVAALATAFMLIAVSQTASAAPVTLYAWYQRSSGGVLSSLMFKAGTAQGCPNNGAAFQQPCYNPAQGGVGVGWTSLNNVVPTISSAGPPSFDWNGTTLTETGLFWATSFISSNPNGQTVISDKVTNFSITPGTSAVAVATYECIEGGFLLTVGAKGCKNINVGTDGYDESPTSWQVGGNPKCVTQTIEGASRVITYINQTANFKEGDTVTGGTSGATATVGGDTDLGTNGALGLVGISGTFQASELLTGSPSGGSATSNSLATAVADDYGLADGGQSGTLTFNTQTANFTLGETITGVSSLAKADIQSQVDNGATGTLTLSNVTGGNFTAGEIITDPLGGSATVGTAPTLTFVLGTAIPRGPVAVNAGAQGAGCAKTSGAFSEFTVVKDDAAVLILADVPAIGACYLFGSTAVSGCPANAALASISYFVFIKPGAPDTDNDGIPNSIDNCPTVINPQQLDADQNGVGDACQVGLDGDGDGILNESDNCTIVSNANQRDTNADGYGNICDADFNGDGTTNVNDFNRLKARLNITPVVDVDTDLDGNGAVNVNDLNRLKTFLGKPPGPSALRPNCPPTCP